MAQPTITVQGNIGTEDVPNWRTIEGASGERIVLCGTGGTSGMTTIPNQQRPVTGTAEIEEVWIGSSGDYYRINTYGTYSNVNMFKVIWSGACASAPRITCYDSGARTHESALLNGTEDTWNESIGKNTSYLKASLSSSGAGEPSPTDGKDGAEVTSDTWQSMQGDTQYLEISSGFGSAGEQTLACVFYTGEHLPPAQYQCRFTFRYTWV